MSTSYRQILRSSSIVGGASLVNILVGLLRNKAAAVLVGPTGVGLIGLLYSLMTTGSTLSALGFGTAGTRQVAEALGGNDLQAMVSARRALAWGTSALALLGGALFWLLRGVLAEGILGDPALAGAVGWLAIGVTLTVAAGSQVALLNGLRRIVDIARVGIWSALLATVLGIGALWLWGEAGIIVFVVSAPLSSFLIGHWFVFRLPKVPKTPIRPHRLLEQWKSLARLGSAFMVASLTASVGQLTVRTVVQHELGGEALGHFQAAWMISMTYIGFVLQAMGTDYYPRLTAAIREHDTTNKLVNEQSEVSLLLAGPIFVGMLGLAPWIIEVLFSNEFGEATKVLRWQVLGDILKVAGWPIAFIILAAGDGRTFMLTESCAIAVFVGLTWIGLPFIGIEAAGIAFVGMYAFYLPLVMVLAKQRTGFVWQRSVYIQLVVLLGVALVVFSGSLWSKWVGAGLGLTAASALGIHSLVRLAHMTGLGGRAGILAEKSRRLAMKIGFWRD